MKQPPSSPTDPSSPNRTKVIILLVFMGLGVLLLTTLAAFALRGSFPSLAFPAPATQTQPFPTLFIPTQYCGQPTLVIGSNTLQIQSISPSAGGAVTVPPDASGAAYWVEGTDQQSIFLLSPTQENIALITGLPEGTTARATWSNCNSMTFTLSASRPGTLSDIYLPGQSTVGMAVFVQTDAAGNGLVVSGGVTEEQISTFNNPPAAPGEIQAEIGLQETTSDENTIQTTVSIYNFGTAPITLTAGDVSLTQRDGTLLAVQKSSPRLPETIAPAETKTFTLTFPRPTTPTATLKVFTVEYDVEGY